MAKSITLELNTLEFDFQNPRLSYDLQEQANENAIIRYMLRDGSLIELMQSIAEMGFSEAEPLLVTPTISHEGFYTVVEGNRRLAALKVLQDPELAEVKRTTVNEITTNAKHKPTTIPVIVYDTRDAILDYLGYRHITGIKEWGALEKAKYLDQLYQRHISSEGEEEIYKSLAKMIGSRADYTRTYHTAYRLMVCANDNAFFGVNIQEKDINFSFITTALSYKDIRNYLCKDETDDVLDPSLNNLDANHYKSIFTWLFDPSKKLIDDSRQIKSIAKVLQYSDAISKLYAGASLSEALQYTSEPNDVFINFVLNAKQNLINAKEGVEALTYKPESALEALTNITSLSKSIRGAIEGLFNEDE